ncbi:hypothetical protein CMV30_10900 [Nibricoccus aquaticus]|uniref:Uncharacterized protein n=2 Tax=Nibricoccus aquaticus TaxID=2576891 RepID=A0A290QKM5_9BACT|nr:hypothetical protein CMV30_10900 [Nibricoccus aquaticus]
MRFPTAKELEEKGVEGKLAPTPEMICAEAVTQAQSAIANHVLSKADQAFKDYLSVRNAPQFEFERPDDVDRCFFNFILRADHEQLGKVESMLSGGNLLSALITKYRVYAAVSEKFLNEGGSQ